MQLSPDQWVRFVIWTGQSNDMGRGPIPQPIESTYTDRAFLYTFNDTWITMREPSHDVSLGSAYPDVWPTPNDLAAGSAALSFTDKWLELHTNPDSKAYRIGIIPGARGGAKLNHFTPSTSLLSNYGATKARVTSVTNAFHRPFAVVFGQGISDAREQLDAETWATRVIQLIESWRIDYNPNISVILIDIGDNPNHPEYPYWDVIRQQQHLVANTVPNVMLVSTGGCTKIDDFHFTYEAQQTIGQSVALALTVLKN